MKRILIISSVLLCAALCSWQTSKKLKGKGAIITSDRQTESFGAVTIEFPLQANITIQPGATPHVRLSGYENILPRIITHVRKNTLYISFEDDGPWSVTNDKKTIADIIVPSLSALHMSGAASADIMGRIEEKEFQLSLSGATDATINDISADRLFMDISGASNVDVKRGSVQKVTFGVSGAANVNAFGLTAGSAVTDISGSATAKVNATNEIDLDVSGTADVIYKGHPKVIHRSVSGVASVHTVD